jgi:hypothetical protein
MSTMYFRVPDPTPERHAAMLLAGTPFQMVPLSVMKLNLLSI